MMSTLGSSVYHRHLDESTHYRGSRPVVVGAPYVLCVFVVAVILLGVGTFVTSHAYEVVPEDKVLLIVGPALLGLGGLLLLGSVLVCVVACCKNRRLQEAFSDDLLTIGGSTFYGGRAFVQLDDETQLHDRPRHHLRNSNVEGVTNPAGPDHNEAVMILANTVAEERDRQRKMSRKYPMNVPQDADRHAEAPGYPRYYVDSHGRPVSRDDAELIDHLGLDRLRRAEAYPELAEDFDLGEMEDTSAVRDRAYSMSVRRPVVQQGPVQNRLRRNVTFTQASRARIQQQKQQQQQKLLLLRQQQQREQQLQLMEQQQQPDTQRKRSSRRRRGRQSKEENSEVITVHQLPQYNPDLLSALGIQPTRPNLERGMSEGLLEPRSQGPQEAWRGDPDITHGSLGNPRRRPSVAMGVRGMKAQHSGSAYRHHSIYASDMDLHRTSLVPGRSTENIYSSLAGGGQESHGFSSPRKHYQTPSLTGSEMEDRRLGSSPVIPLPHPDEGSMSSLNRFDSRRDNSSMPRSSSESPRLGRPLSYISSESCCSGCCDSSLDGPRGDPVPPGDDSNDEQLKNDAETGN